MLRQLEKLVNYWLNILTYPLVETARNSSENSSVEETVLILCYF